MERVVRSAPAIRFVYLIAFVFALTLAEASAGDPPVFGYGVVFNNATQAYDFVSFPPVAAIAPLGGQLVAATAAGTDFAQIYAIDADANLVIVDTATGSESLIGSLGVEALQRVSLAADPATGVLLAIIGDSNCVLTIAYTIDPTTGLATPLGPVPECVASVAADVAHQVLYFLDSGASAVNVVDAGGNETTLGNLGVPLNASARILIDPVSGGLFLTQFEFPSFSNSLYAVDTTTGAASFVMDIGGVNPLGAPVLAPPESPVMDVIFADGFDP